jgi:hypothetical protein
MDSVQALGGLYCELGELVMEGAFSQVGDEFERALIKLSFTKLSAMKCEQ